MKDRDIMENWFMQNLGSSVSVILAGQIFGGAIGEMPQTVRELDFEYDQFSMKFASTETLTVARPAKIKIGKQNQLIVTDASKAVFGWHHYGAPQTDETWTEISYIKSKKRVQVTWTGVISDKRVIDYSGDKFVELLLI